VANPTSKACGAFYSPQGNLAIGMSETRTCLDREADMSDHRLWNPAKKSDKDGVTKDKAERPYISRLGVGHVRVRSLELE
jgi:hypothetical protein